MLAPLNKYYFLILKEIGKPEMGFFKVMKHSKFGIYEIPSSIPLIETIYYHQLLHFIIFYK